MTWNGIGCLGANVYADKAGQCLVLVVLSDCCKAELV